MGFGYCMQELVALVDAAERVLSVTWASSTLRMCQSIDWALP